MSGGFFFCCVFFQIENLDLNKQEKCLLEQTALFSSTL